MAKTPLYFVYCKNMESNISNSISVFIKATIEIMNEIYY